MEDRLEDSATRYAVAAGATLLAAVVLGLLMAFFGDRVHSNGLYIPVAMAVLLGWPVGAYSGRVARRLGLQDRLPMALCTILGATLAYAAYVVMSYVGVIDVLMTELPRPMDNAVTDPAIAVQTFLQHYTGEEGVWGYLAFVTDDGDPRVSPWGLLAALKPSIGWTCVLMAVEWLVCVAAATLAGLHRSGMLTTADDSGAMRHVVTGIDEQGLMNLMRDIEAGDIEGAAQRLAKNQAQRGIASHIVCIEYDDPSAAEWRLVFYETHGDRIGAKRAERCLSGLLAQAFWDEFRGARAAIETAGVS